LKPKLQALRDKISTLQGKKANAVSFECVRHRAIEQSCRLATWTTGASDLEMRSTLFLTVFVDRETSDPSGRSHSVLPLGGAEKRAHW
jgi:hypothetical protein